MGEYGMQRGPWVATRHHTIPPEVSTDISSSLSLSLSPSLSLSLSLSISLSLYLFPLTLSTCKGHCTSWNMVTDSCSLFDHNPVLRFLVVFVVATAKEMSNNTHDFFSFRARLWSFLKFQLELFCLQVELFTYNGNVRLAKGMSGKLNCKQKSWNCKWTSFSLLGTKTFYRANPPKPRLEASESEVDLVSVHFAKRAESRNAFWGGVLWYVFPSPEFPPPPFQFSEKSLPLSALTVHTPALSCCSRSALKQVVWNSPTLPRGGAENLHPLIIPRKHFIKRIVPWE